MIRAITILLLLFNGVTAVYGGYMLIDDPSGNSIGLPVEWLGKSPFTNYLVPALVLFWIIGVGSLIVCLFLFFKKKYAPGITMLSGVAMVIWIVTQVLMIRQTSGLQLIFIIDGLSIISLGATLRRRERLAA